MSAKAIAEAEAEAIVEASRAAAAAALATHVLAEAGSAAAKRVAIDDALARAAALDGLAERTVATAAVGLERGSDSGGGGDDDDDDDWGPALDTFDAESSGSDESGGSPRRNLNPRNDRRASNFTMLFGATPTHAPIPALAAVFGDDDDDDGGDDDDDGGGVDEPEGGAAAEEEVRAGSLVAAEMSASAEQRGGRRRSKKRAAPFVPISPSGVPFTGADAAAAVTTRRQSNFSTVFGASPTLSVSGHGRGEHFRNVYSGGDSFEKVAEEVVDDTHATGTAVEVAGEGRGGEGGSGEAEDAPVTRAAELAAIAALIDGVHADAAARGVVSTAGTAATAKQQLLDALSEEARQSSALDTARAAALTALGSSDDSGGADARLSVAGDEFAVHSSPWSVAREAPEIDARLHVHDFAVLHSLVRLQAEDTR